MLEALRVVNGPFLSLSLFSFLLSVVKSALKARLSTKRKAQSPWGFFPLKRSSLSKARSKRAFLSFFIKLKARFFELFVYFF